jgi:hypothetical protein
MNHLNVFLVEKFRQSNLGPSCLGMSSRCQFCYIRFSISVKESRSSSSSCCFVVLVVVVCEHLGLDLKSLSFE